MAFDDDGNIDEKGPRRIIIRRDATCRCFNAHLAKCQLDDKTPCEGHPNADGVSCFLDKGPALLVVRTVGEGDGNIEPTAEDADTTAAQDGAAENGGQEAQDGDAQGDDAQGDGDGGA
jgi:hypothetical protein